MYINLLPDCINNAISKLSFEKLTEIRIRNNLPIYIEYNGTYTFLSKNGKTSDANQSIRIKCVEDVLSALIGNDVYNYSEQIKNGFITIDGGIRIGICGEYVFNGDNLITVRKPTSLNIRIAHEILGCADTVAKDVFSNELTSLLIFSAPGKGKTTILRDFARYLSERRHNVLIFDERSEIAFTGSNLGPCVDIVKGGNKIVSFERAIRTMKPDVIITDELYGNKDFLAVESLLNSGIPIIASSHTMDKEQLKRYAFNFYLELTGINKKQILYDKNFNVIGNYNNL